MSYSELLKDPRWQKKRLEIFQRDNWTCFECGDAEKTLHCHHKRYISGKLPWDYPSENFLTLCEKCHDMEEWLKEDTVIQMCYERIDGKETRRQLARIIFYSAYMIYNQPDEYEILKAKVNEYIDTEGYQKWRAGDGKEVH